MHNAAGEAAHEGVVLVQVLLQALDRVGRAQVVGRQPRDAALRLRGRRLRIAHDPQKLPKVKFLKGV